MSRAGYRVLLSSSLEESIRFLTEYMQNARVCCRLCGKSFASERTLQTHEARHHPAAIAGVSGFPRDGDTVSGFPRDGDSAGAQLTMCTFAPSVALDKAT